MVTNTRLDGLRTKHASALAGLREVERAWLARVPPELTRERRAVDELESQIERAGGTVEYDDEGNVSYGEVE